MGVFFVGIGLAAISTSFVQNPIRAIGLFIIGMFAAIYHPVGLAMIARGDQQMWRDIAFNGVWGNMGVGCAALLTGFLIDLTGWRTVFWLPGLISLLFGLAYLVNYWDRLPLKNAVTTSVNKPSSKNTQQISSDEWRVMLIRVTGIIFSTTAVAGIVFQGTTFALPKVFEEQVGGIATTATMLGWLTFIVFAVASFSQLVVGKILIPMAPERSSLGLPSFKLSSLL